MVKRILLLTSVLLASLLLWAAPVSPEQALNEAAAFVAQKQGAGRPLKMASHAQRLKSEAQMGYYYVFNIGVDQGFVIVSGDDRTAPILGYSDQGRFDSSRLPVNMRSWLEGYAEQMRILDEMTDDQARKSLAAPRSAVSVPTRNSIAPLITTRWDQASPYWNECPEFMSITEAGDTVGDLNLPVVWPHPCRKS